MGIKMLNNADEIKKLATQIENLKESLKMRILDPITEHRTNSRIVNLTLQVELLKREQEG